MDYHVIITYTFLLFAQVLSWFGIGQKFKLKPWYLFFLVAIIAGYTGNLINIYAILYTTVFGIICYYYQVNNTAWLAMAVTCLALPLVFHYHPIGFSNYKFLDNIKITERAYPYSLYFNFDKTLIGIFILGFSALNLKKQQVKQIASQLAKHILGMVFIVLGIALLIGYIYFEPKYPQFTPVWILVNLFFVCTSEEVLFREIIQNQLSKLIKGKYSNTIPILIAAVLFGLMHFSGGIYYILLATICGLFYGYIYFKTKEIRSAILLHFAVNLVHFLLFTYPGAQK